MSRGIAAELAARVRLVLLDVDGVLTDGAIYAGATEDGTAVELKRFEITDQLGIKMLQRAGIPVIFVSGRESAATRIRAAELGVEQQQIPGGFKLGAVERLLAERGVDWDGVAFVGDDLADLSVMRRAGLPVAVRNAVPEVRAAARWRTSVPGGHGAVREFAEALLRGRGSWSELVEAYVAEREGRSAAPEGAARAPGGAGEAA